jgi:glucose-6-phosphate isomerase
MIFHSVLYPKETIPECEFGFLDDMLGLDCFSIVNETEDLRRLENPRLQKWLSFKNFVIFGTGGSSLGGQCIKEALQRSELPCGPCKCIKFAQNLDPSSMEEIFSQINIAETGFLCISKSGETLETVVQLLIAIDALKKCHYSSDLSSRFVVITQDSPSTLKQIAAKFDFFCLDHPKTIGGRCSVFSIVGMLPAVMCGVDPMRIRSGGKLVIDNFMANVKAGASFIYGCFSGLLDKNPAKFAAASENFSDADGETQKRGTHQISQHVSFIYSDKLLPFAEWLAQLYAESSGKSGIGVTPLTARGAVDQHSQLQLYLDGPNDKCFSFFVEKQNSEIAVGDIFVPEKFLYLKNKKISDVFQAQCDATMASLLEKRRSIRKIEVQSVTPEVLGALFMHFMLEVVCVCNLMKVNPFDQPAVERGKSIARDLLMSGLCYC